MPNPYTYNLAADFPDSAINPTNLHKEIDDSSIATSLVEVRVSSGTVTIEFTGDISAGDKTTLDGDTTAPAGGLIAAHDNTARLVASVITVDDDPTITAVDAPMGSMIVYNNVWYRKNDDGSSTNVSEDSPMTVEAGEAGGSLLQMIPFTTDPSPATNDLYLVERDGIVELCFRNSTTTFTVGSARDADICHVYASSVGAADVITAGTPENLLKGCTLADAGELGANWTIENGGTDTVEFKYGANRTKLFLVNAVVDFTSDEINVFELLLNKGAAEQTNSSAKAKCAVAADGVTMTMLFVISLAKNDTLRLMIDAAATTPIATVRTFQVTVTPI